MATLHPVDAALPLFEQHEARGADLLVYFPQGDAVLAFLQHNLSFVHFTHQGDEGFSLPATSFLRLTSHGYRISGPRALQDCPLQASPSCESTYSFLLAHLDHQLPQVQCATIDQWHSLLWWHTMVMLQDEEQAALVTHHSEMDLFTHQQPLDPSDIEDSWLFHLRISDLVDAYGIPTGFDFFYLMGPSFLVASRTPGQPLQQAWHAVRLHAAEFHNGIRSAVNDDANSFSMGFIVDLLRSGRFPWAATSSMLDDTSRFVVGAATRAAVSRIADVVEYTQGNRDDELRVATAHIRKVLATSILQLKADPGSEADTAVVEDVHFSHRFPSARQMLNLFPTASSREVVDNLKRLYAARPDSPGGDTGAANVGIMVLVQVVDDMLVKRPPDIICSNSDTLSDHVSEILATMGAEATASLEPAGTTATTGLGVTASGDLAKTSIKLLIDKMNESDFAIHGERLRAIQGDQTNPDWDLLVLKDIMIRADPTATSPRIQADIIVQLVWSMRRFTSTQNPVCAIVRTVCQRRDLFVSRYLVFGPSLGIDSTDYALRDFQLPQRFFKHFWAGTFKDIHVWNDICVPIINASRHSGINMGANMPDVPFITQERMSRLQRYLTRISDLLYIIDDGDFSMTALLDYCEKLLERSDDLPTNLTRVNMVQKVQSLFEKAWTTGGQHVVSKLLSDDPTITPTKVLLPATATQIKDEFQRASNSVNTFIQIHRDVPGFFQDTDGVTQAAQPPTHHVSHAACTRSVTPATASRFFVCNVLYARTTLHALLRLCSSCDHCTCC